MAELWSDYTDFVLTSLDKTFADKYKLQIRDIISNPDKYASQKDIEKTLTNMREDANSYIDSSISTMPEEKTALEDALAKADSITKQISDNLSVRAKQYKIPIVKPVSVEREVVKDEVISIDSANSDTLALIEKLTESSSYIADMTYTYNESLVGSWFFSGSKNYVLDIFMPDNDVALLEASRAEINDLIDSVLAVIRGI